MNAVADAAAVAPDGPGVYFFLGPDDELLYIGKATHLRRRLRQHVRSGASGVDPRAHLRLATAARVAWEETADEEAAAAREADLIVALAPTLNASIAGDGRWVYVVVTEEGRDADRVPLRFALTVDAPGGRDDHTRGRSRERVYGCFPHLGRGVSSRRAIACSEGYAALLRLLWAASDAQGSHYPRVLGGVSPPQDVTVTVTAADVRRLHDLLAGTSRRILDDLFVRATTQRSPVLHPGLARDRAAAGAFFEHGPAALRGLRLRHQLDPGPIDRDTIVGLLTREVEAVVGPFHVAADAAGDGVLAQRVRRMRAVRALREATEQT